RGIVDQLSIFFQQTGAEPRTARFPLERFVRAACGGNKSENYAQLGVRAAAGGANAVLKRRRRRSLGALCYTSLE
ncbi:MAG: hypothetical protein KAU38_15380, partial [Desulfobacterales bacterium]|nr:hypothetical protein [Desulfobacterales bacterium]